MSNEFYRHLMEVDDPEEDDGYPPWVPENPTHDDLVDMDLEDTRVIVRDSYLFGKKLDPSSLCNYLKWPRQVAAVAYWAVVYDEKYGRKTNDVKRGKLRDSPPKYRPAFRLHRRSDRGQDPGTDKR